MAGKYDSPEHFLGSEVLEYMEAMVTSIEAKASPPYISPLYEVSTKALSNELRVLLNIVRYEQDGATEQRKLENLQHLDDILQKIYQTTKSCSQLMDGLHSRGKMTAIFRRAADLRRIRELQGEVKMSRVDVERRFIRLKSHWSEPAESTRRRSQDLLNGQQEQQLEVLNMNAPSAVAPRVSRARNKPPAVSTTNLANAIIDGGHFNTGGRDMYHRTVYDYSQNTTIHNYFDGRDRLSE
ncbi:hypothetical protein D9757_007721 [Collybiopsis confluens]|uniref:Uncharacterized protein n=1 Tax=Collybiopsis confluens TaxID=2823264 RepID=A0A8H5H4Y1_9AGAR|nr:hypothetical protein D9757_007721 [Collybiopsis confluens]